MVTYLLSVAVPKTRISKRNWNIGGDRGHAAIEMLILKVNNVINGPCKSDSFVIVRLPNEF